MDEIRLGSRTLEPHRQLLVNGRREPLGKRALDVLSVLAEAGGKIVTKDELLAAVWPGAIVEENALQVHIVALRKALGPEAYRLRTIRGVGYQLDVDDAAETCAAPTTDESGKDEPGSVPLPEPPQTVRRTLALGRLRQLRPALIVIAVLGALVVAVLFAGPKLGLWGGERIPVVVRTLAASGSGDPSETALANGITDELIDRLRRIPALRIATVGTTGIVEEASFKDAYVVDGSIRRSGGQLRVMVRLADADGEILWTQTFERRLVDLLDMQERIAASIADALSVSFDVGINSTAYGGTDNPEAYAAFLEANATAFNLDQSVPQQHLDRALALDPNYVQALAVQATRYPIRLNATVGLTRNQVTDLLQRADETSARALAPNPDLWIGHAARTWYLLARKDFASAQRSIRDAARLDHGNEPGLRSFLAVTEQGFGRTNKSLAMFASAELIDPVGRYNSAKVGALVNLSRFQEALDLSNTIAAGDPVALQNLSGQIFWSHMELGEEDAAVRFAERYFPPWAGELRDFRADKSLPRMSPAALRQWADRRYGAGGGVLIANVAHFAGFEGHPQLAVELMRVAFERPSGGVIGMLWHPAMAEARKTDEFERLVTDLGLVKIWRESGDWGDYCRPVSAREIACS